MMQTKFTWMWVGVAVLTAAAIAYYLWQSRESAMETDAGGAELQRYRAAGLEIGVAIEPTTPRVGDNRLIVEIEDAEGNPVTGIDFNARAEMPAMGAMPAMRAPADLEETAPGHYDGMLELSMRGEWPMTLAFESPSGEPVRLQFDYATDRAGLTLAAGATPVGGADTADGSGANEDGMPRYQAGGYEIGVTTEPETPRVGDNRLVVEVRDPNGEPVDDIDVQAHAEMPAMGAMPAMRAPADLERTAPGRFEGMLDLSMRGEWPLTVTLEQPAGDAHRLQFDFATDRPGLAIAAGGTPVGGAAMAEDDGNVITIDSRRRQMIGLETAEATHRDLVRSIRAVGQVAYNERLRSEVALKFDGYIGELEADYVGAKVERGQVLFTVYGPELLAAQQEYLNARARGADDALVRAARERLLLWDIAPAEIEALERRGEPASYLPIRAPRDGTVTALNMADGSAVRNGRTLLAISDLSRVWVEAQVYEADLALVNEGMPATVTLPYLPEHEFRANIDYVYPFLQGRTRTGRVRLALDNPTGTLKPDMYAEVSLAADVGHHLAVPEEAVIVAGTSRVVFVDLGNGRLKPVRITTGHRAQGYVQVRDGLALGDRVVTSGNFLIAAEARLKTEMGQW